METKYVPEFVMHRKTCECCGDSIIEFSEMQRPYFCGDCDIKLTK
jgi:hypothetical protein